MIQPLTSGRVMHGLLCAGMLLLSLLTPAPGMAEVRTVSATGEYRMGDNDTRTDAKRLALLDAKRLALERVGTYVESITEVRNLQLTHDDIRAYTAGIVEVKEAKTYSTAEGETMVVYVDVVCEIDPAEVTRQIATLGRNQAAADKLRRMQAEIDTLRARLEEQAQALAAAKTKPEAEKAMARRREVLVSPNITRALPTSTIAVFQMRLVQDAPSKDSEPMTLLEPKLNGSGRTSQMLHVQKAILLDQTAVASANVMHSREGAWINITFTDKGARQLERVTGQNIQRRLAIIIDGWVVVAPVIQETIAGGKAQITGVFSDEEAAELAAKINDAVKRRS